MILADTDVLIEIFDKNSNKGAAALQRIEDAGEDISLTSWISQKKMQLFLPDLK